MATSRRIIKDHHWAKMEPQCLGLKSHPGRTGSDARLFLEAVFWNEPCRAIGPSDNGECEPARCGAIRCPAGDLHSKSAERGPPDWTCHGIVPLL